MVVKTLLQGGWKGLRDLFYPPCCMSCGNALVDNETVVCQECLDKMPYTYSIGNRQNQVENLFWDIKKLQKAGAYCYYKHETPIVTLIHKLKYYQKPKIGEFLGELAGRDIMLTNFAEDVDFLVPVPLHPKREKKRGYNQSELICNGISKVTGIPVDITHLKRKRNTSSQTLQSMEERYVNLNDAFSVDMPWSWRGKHILLVDDVITTGTTIRECIRQITPIHKTKVSVFSLAVAFNLA
mgnify:CR=1 FL=1